MDAEARELANLISEYIKKRESDRLEKFDKDAQKQRSQATADTLTVPETDLAQQREAERTRFQPANWLEDAAQRAGQLQFVTHALKFIHSDAKGTSLAATFDSASDASYIATACLAKAEFDVVGNAAALDVGKLLLLQYRDKRVIDYVAVDDASVFSPLAENQQQAERWLSCLKAVLSAKELSSHKLAKQTYWPVGEDTYHLLSPLYATALAHEIFNEVQHQRYSEVAKETRAARKNAEYSAQTDVRYTQIAVQSFGGTKPQNISQLNSQRGGKVFLFSAQPPQWQSQEKPPQQIRSIFSQRFERQLFYLIKPLKIYLESISEQDTNRWLKLARERGVDDILNRMLELAVGIQNLPPGWSAKPDCKLPFAEQCWLDPGRVALDDDFADERDKDEWQAEVADNFARWLCKKLESKKLALGSEEQRHFRALLEPELRLNLKGLEGVAL